MTINVLTSYVQISDAVASAYNDYVSLAHIIKFRDNEQGQLVVQTSDGIETTYANESTADVLAAVQLDL